MQVSVESLGGLQRKMSVQIPAAEIDSEVEQRLRKVSKTASLKGFRPGKIPFKVIMQRYGDGVRQDVLSDLMRNSYAKAVSEQKLQPAGNPRIEAEKAAQGEDLQFTATFEIYPDVVLKKVEGLKVERPVADITDADIERVLENLRQQRAHWHEVERAAADGDRLKIDFSGTIDGEPFEGGQGEDVEVVLGSGQMLADFDKGLLGAVQGEKRDIKLKFPKDYGASELAKKKAVFAVSVHTVSEQHLPEVDDEFCSSFGVDEGGVSALRDGIKQNMEREIEQRIRESMREQLLDDLVSGNPVELPQTLVDQEVEQLRSDAARRMGITEAEQMPAADPFIEGARRRVGLGLIVGAIVNEHKIEADDAAVAERLDQLVGSFDEPEKIKQAYHSDPRLMNQIQMAVIEEKVIDWLLDKAKVKEVKKSFHDIMQLDD